MIFRLTTILAVCAIIAAAFGLYVVKYKVMAIQSEIASTNKQLEEQRESLRVVSAEWAYLNRPERLQKLADKYLNLKPVQPDQIGDVAAVPFPGRQFASGDAFQPVSTGAR